MDWEKAQVLVSLPIAAICVLVIIGHMRAETPRTLAVACKTIEEKNLTACAGEITISQEYVSAKITKAEYAQGANLLFVEIEAETSSKVRAIIPYIFDRGEADGVLHSVSKVSGVNVYAGVNDLAYREVDPVE